LRGLDFSSLSHGGQVPSALCFQLLLKATIFWKAAK
jgi:hypothetical protein